MGKKINVSLPQGLSTRVRQYIRYVEDELNEKGLLKDVDSAALVALALNYELMLQSSKEMLVKGVLKKNQYGEEVASSAQVPFFKSSSGLKTYLTEFGLTPKSRESIEALIEEAEDKSPLDEMIGKGMMRIAK